MNKNLELLLKLQETDLLIAKLEAEIEQIPKDIDASFSSCKAAKDALQQAKDDIEEDNKKRREMERSVGSENDHMSKCKIKLNEVKTNKEYQALLHEIEAIKKKVVDIEDGELELMEFIEGKKAMLPKKEALVKEEEEKFNAVKKEREADMERVKELLAQKKSSREAIFGGIEAEVLRRYERINNGKPGPAIVREVDDCCQGCDLEIPPQLAIEVRKGEEVQFCPFCGRILYSLAAQSASAG